MAFEWAAKLYAFEGCLSKLKQGITERILEGAGNGKGNRIGMRLNGEMNTTFRRKSNPAGSMPCQKQGGTPRAGSVLSLQDLRGAAMRAHLTERFEQNASILERKQS